MLERHELYSDEQTVACAFRLHSLHDAYNIVAVVVAMGVVVVATVDEVVVVASAVLVAVVIATAVVVAAAVLVVAGMVTVVVVATVASVVAVVSTDVVVNDDAVVVVVAVAAVVVVCALGDAFDTIIKTKGTKMRAITPTVSTINPTGAKDPLCVCGVRRGNEYIVF